MYHLALHKMLAGRGEDLTHAYPFDVRPMRDDRPYYSGFLRLDRLGMYLDQVRDVSEEWGSSSCSASCCRRCSSASS